MSLSNRRRIKPSMTSHRSLFIEHLETRQVLTTLSGFVFEDVNANEQQDAADLPIPGVTVGRSEPSPGVVDEDDVAGLVQYGDVLLQRIND